MINHLTALDLQGIASRGGSLEVDGAVYTAMDLQGIAIRLTPGAHLKIHNSKTKTALDLQGIASSKPGQVVFA